MGVVSRGVCSSDSEANDGGGGGAFAAGGGGWIYWSEDDTEDDDYEGTFFTDSFGEAAEDLEESYGQPIERLCVIPPQHPPEDDDNEADDNENEDGSAVVVIRNNAGNDAVSFRRFVSGLAPRPGRAVRKIHFDNVDWDAVHEDDLERIFGGFLPAHPTLEAIGLGGNEIPQPYARLLAASIGAGVGTTVPPLPKLELQCAIDHDSIKVVADMIRRNVPLTELRVDPLMGPRLGPDDCRLICQSVLHNPNLRVLQLETKVALGDTLDEVAAHSSLRRLVLSADDWARECVESVATLLRTNTTQRNEDPSPFFHPIVEVPKTSRFVGGPKSLLFRSTRSRPRSSPACGAATGGSAERSGSSSRPNPP